jgi:hypothetical protein
VTRERAPSHAAVAPTCTVARRPFRRFRRATSVTHSNPRPTPLDLGLHRIRPMRALSPAGRGLSLVASWLLAASPLWVADLAHAQWKWRDASGRVTASDLPPPREVPDKDILQRPTGAARKAPQAAVASSAPVSAAAASLPQVRASGVDKDLEARKKLADQQREAKAKADADKLAATRAENCRRARDHVATMQSGQRIARINDKGEREVLDDRAREQEVQRAREVMASDCAP